MTKETRTIKTECDTIKLTFNNDQETKDKLFDKMLDFYIRHQRFSRESIMQSDGPQEEAPILISEIADDLLQLDAKYEKD